MPTHRIHRSWQYGRAHGRQFGQVGRACAWASIWSRRRVRRRPATACRSSPTPAAVSRMPTWSSACCRPASTSLSVWNDILPAANQGALFIDCSTIDVTSARKAHALAAERGIATLDAPVSGGVGGAKAATLTFMVGGTKHAFARGKPVLERMGKRVVHCGEAGNGQAAKICNNMILGISMIAVSEAFVLGEKLGLSHQALFDVASASSGQCWSLTSYCPVPGPVPASPANNGYKPGFAAALDAEGSQACPRSRSIGEGEDRARCASRRDLRAIRGGRPQRHGLLRDHQARARAVEHH